MHAAVKYKQTIANCYFLILNSGVSSQHTTSIETKFGTSTSTKKVLYVQWGTEIWKRSNRSWSLIGWRQTQIAWQSCIFSTRTAPKQTRPEQRFDVFRVLSVFAEDRSAADGHPRVFGYPLQVLYECSQVVILMEESKKFHRSSKKCKEKTIPEREREAGPAADEINCQQRLLILLKRVSNCFPRPFTQWQLPKRKFENLFRYVSKI